MKNHINNVYNTPYQLKLPLEIEKIIEISDPVYTFCEVFNQIDLKRYLVVKESRTGRKRFDCEILLKVILFAFMEHGYVSTREIEKLCKTDIRTVSESGKEKRRNMSEMLEKILSDENIKTAYKRVYANKGAGGVDGVTTNELEEYMKEHWKGIKQQIRERKYKPQPVLRVEIPKPNGGVRKLGIPTVIDRVIEQAITQVLTPIFESIFSENSYGFRPNRRCEQAIVKLLEYFNDGYIWIVDIDLEKFFDNVPQDKLMSFVLSSCGKYLLFSFVFCVILSIND